MKPIETQPGVAKTEFVNESSFIWWVPLEIKGTADVELGRGGRAERWSPNWHDPWARYSKLTLRDVMDPLTGTKVGRLTVEVNAEWKEPKEGLWVHFVNPSTAFRECIMYSEGGETYQIPAGGVELMVRVEPTSRLAEALSMVYVPQQFREVGDPSAAGGTRAVMMGGYFNRVPRPNAELEKIDRIRTEIMKHQVPDLREETARRLVKEEFGSEKA
jgi:hypothetical protein